MFQPTTSPGPKPSRFQNRARGFANTEGTGDNDSNSVTRPGTHYIGSTRPMENRANNLYASNSYDQRKQRTKQSSSSYVGSSYQSSSYVNTKAIMNNANTKGGGLRANVPNLEDPMKEKDTQIDRSSALPITKHISTTNQQRETAFRAMPSKPRFSQERESSSGSGLDYGDEPRLRKKAKITNNGTQNSRYSSASK